MKQQPIICHYCQSVHNVVVAKVRAKNIFGDLVEVCNAHYRKWCDADLRKLDQSQLINGFSSFEQHWTPELEKWKYTNIFEPRTEVVRMD